MTTTSHTHQDRIAGTTSGFIAPAATADGDASPITHTHPTASPGQMASTRTQTHQAPHSFTANNRTAVALVVAMVAVVLTQAVLALAAVMDDSPQRSWIIAVAVGGLLAFGALLTVPAALASRNAILANRHGCDEDIVVLGDGFWSIDEEPPR